MITTHHDPNFFLLVGSEVEWWCDQPRKKFFEDVSWPFHVATCSTTFHFLKTMSTHLFGTLPWPIFETYGSAAQGPSGPPLLDPCTVSAWWDCVLHNCVAAEGRAGAPVPFPGPSNGTFSCFSSTMPTLQKGSANICETAFSCWVFRVGIATRIAHHICKRAKGWLQRACKKCESFGQKCHRQLIAMSKREMVSFGTMTPYRRHLVCGWAHTCTHTVINTHNVTLYTSAMHQRIDEHLECTQIDRHCRC